MSNPWVILNQNDYNSLINMIKNKKKKNKFKTLIQTKENSYKFMDLFVFNI